MAVDIKGLEAQRQELYGKLSGVGDCRRGSAAETYRKCGKLNCACYQADHPRHGPRYLLMTKVGGQSRAQQLEPGPELDKTGREVAAR